MKKKPPLIAIVDDEESVRKAIQRLLRSAGMDVETFPSGAKFLDAMVTRAFDCAVLDLHMPGMGGIEIQTYVMQSGKWLSIIMMTGHDTPGSRTRALAGGAAAYLLKPVDDKILIAAIETAITNNKH